MKKAAKAYGIPTAITVSRETGKVVEVTREDLKAEDFRKICSELTKAARKEREEVGE